MLRTLLPLVFVAACTACDSVTTAPEDENGLKPSANATVTLSEFPVNVNFTFFSVCLNAPVNLSGTAYWSIREVVRPDGSRHLTILMDVAVSSGLVSARIFRRISAYPLPSAGVIRKAGFLGLGCFVLSLGFCPFCFTFVSSF